MQIYQPEIARKEFSSVLSSNSQTFFFRERASFTFAYSEHPPYTLTIVNTICCLKIFSHWNVNLTPTRGKLNMLKDWRNCRDMWTQMTHTRVWGEWMKLSDSILIRRNGISSCRSLLKWKEVKRTILLKPQIMWNCKREQEQNTKFVFYVGRIGFFFFFFFQSIGNCKSCFSYDDQRRPHHEQ